MKNDVTRFVYVTFIRTTPDRLWSALTTPTFVKQFWFGMTIETEWKAGSPWKLLFPDGRVADAGEIAAFEPPTRFVIKWRNEWKPELKAEGFSHCTFELEPLDGVVKLSVTHEIGIADSKLIQAVSGGWPQILSNLKSLLETGEAALKNSVGKH